MRFDRGVETRSGQTYDCKNGICYFSAKHVALRSKTKHCLGWYQDNVRMEWHVYLQMVASVS